ncbi:MAG: Xaa-Pro peptidase family protein [Acidimicrobiales bacterium]|jgi:Xaa-Pro aminopeptidase
MTAFPPAAAFEPVCGLFQTNFSPGELAERRAKVVATIGDGIAVVQGAGAAGGVSLFRQVNDFYYLCGVEIAHSYLLIDGVTGRSTLYLPHRDSMEVSDGPRLCSEDAGRAAALTGVDAVSSLETFSLDLQRFVLKRGAFSCYTPFSPAEQGGTRDQLLRARALAAADGWAAPQAREGHFVETLRTRFPSLEVRDLTPVTDKLRLIKSDREADLCRRAGRLAGLAVAEAMRSSEPGVTEYELAALATFCFGLGGARGEGYRAIVATGHNAWFAHYGRLGDVLEDGQLVLMDYAPDVAYYTSDIGRMWPVSGTYSPLQRLLYGFMVEYHKELLGCIHPGARARDILDGAAEVMRSRIEATTFPEACYRDAALRTLEFPGHLSHTVGMAVHDVGSYWDEPLAPGTMFAVDPQMWVPEVEMYVRVEDTVLVTHDGVEVLTTTAPLELDDVEATMRDKGMLEVVRSLREEWAMGRWRKPSSAS